MWARAMTAPIRNASFYDPSALWCSIEPNASGDAPDDDGSAPLECSLVAGCPTPPVASAAPAPPPETSAVVPASARDGEVRRDAGESDRVRPVLSLGLVLSAASSLGGTSAPGGRSGDAIAAGVYLDFDGWELGTYRRVEQRSAVGVFTGAGVELGVTRDRDDFEGVRPGIFAEGGELGRYGVQASFTSVRVSVGVGQGGALGSSVTTTEVTPRTTLDALFE